MKYYKSIKLACVLLFGLFLVSCGGVTPGQVRGIVIDHQGQPVAKTKVCLVGAGFYGNMYTADFHSMDTVDGVFLFEDVNSGYYVLVLGGFMSGTKCTGDLMVDGDGKVVVTYIGTKKGVDFGEIKLP